MSACFGNNHYFVLFELPVAFDIDKNLLKNTLLSLQKQHHPDTNDKSKISSDLINFAFDTLYNDDLRAIYLLELAGIDINLDQTINDLDFLDLMMDSRIILAESDEPATIDKTKTQLDELQKNIANDFNQAYKNKDWQIAKQLALKLKFLAKLNDDFKELNYANQQKNDDDLYV